MKLVLDLTEKEMALLSILITYGVLCIHLGEHEMAEDSIALSDKMLSQYERILDINAKEKG